MARERDVAGEQEDASTYQRAAYDLDAKVSPSFALVVIEGPDVGLSLAIDGSARVLVGSAPSASLRLTDREVSRRHLALELLGRRLRLTDLESTNGTWVDGVAVVEGFVRGGEVIRIGGTAIRLDVAEERAAAPLPTATSFGNFIGGSVEMRRMYPALYKLAASSVSLIIEGETGTGKEVLAEAVHEMGARADGPFIIFDCTSVAPSLVESELFGHERGAFTGAVASRKGVFEQAHGGTLLIDEIGDLESSLQPKLLRALERSEVRKVGGDRFIHVDVRVIAATRRDLDREVQAGRFREDLLYRLAVGRIELPPLRHRGGDIPLLVAHFCKQMGSSVTRIPSDVMRRWEDSAWPGNLRELRNAVARYLALGEYESEVQGASFGMQGQPAPIPASLGDNDVLEGILAMKLPLTEAKQRLLEEFEQRYLERVLEEHGGNVTRAAEASRIGRRYFQRLRAKRT